MIENLDKDIEDLEKMLLEKKAQRAQLLEELSHEEGSAKKNHLIVIVELHDQFYSISDISLIENTPDDIKRVKDTCTNEMYHYELRLYEVNDSRKEFEYLQSMLSLNTIGLDAIEEWMGEHSSEEIVPQKCVSSSLSMK